MASVITLKSTNDSIVNIKNVGTTTGTTEVTVPNRNMTMGTEITLGTAQATTSGTFKDFTIPSGVKRVTVMFDGVSTNGTSIIQIQLGVDGVAETTGYTCFGATFSGTSATSATSGFIARVNVSSTDATSGEMSLARITGNTFISNATFITVVNSISTQSTGAKTLSAELTTVRITTVNGTDTFDAGTVNVSWEF